MSLVCGAGLVCAAQGPADSNPQVEGVLAALGRTSATPRAILCDAGGFDVPRGGHLQGIQQAVIDGRPFLVLSGSASAQSYLALVALEGSMGRVVAVKPLMSRPFKHAGGFQVCGDYLAVGIEDDNTKMTSRVWILRLAELLQAAGPRPLVEIERTGAYQRATAGAVAMARVRDRHLLCVGTWDSATIDISSNTSIDDLACLAFRETWDARNATVRIGRTATTRRTRTSISWSTRTIPCSWSGSLTPAVRMSWTYSSCGWKRLCPLRSGFGRS